MADTQNIPSDFFRPASHALPADARSWQQRRAIHLVAALAVIAPMAILSVWMHLLQESSITANELLLWPLLGGGTLIFWILFLHVLVCGDELGSLGFRVGRPWLDLGLGAILSVALLLFHFAFYATVGRLFPPRPPAEEIVELMAGLARDPWMLVLWLGPVVWIGVALCEELMRAFLLRRLWLVWHGPAGRWAVVAVISAFIGLAHGYQGPAAIVCIGIQSSFLGWFFMSTGRIRALVVAHALYDSIQIVMAVVAIRAAGL
jgi:membrane protease YdiL (CAAX protease family)